MGGFFGVASKEDSVFDLFFGIDYHSHLGTRRGGMAVYGEDGFNRSIHNIENSPFRTKFDKDIQTMKGKYGIGCISDYEPQPLIVRSHHGTYALTTVSKINNMDELTKMLFDKGHSHFQEMSGGEINATELVAALINQKDNLIEGMNYALEKIDGSLSILLMNHAGIYAARDKYGRTPIVIGRKEGAFCASFEKFAYKNLGYTDYKELGPGEIVVMTENNCITLQKPGDDMKICTFLWVYYGYPASSYEGVSVEQMRYNCGMKMAQRDNVKPDIVAGVPDSGIAHAVGYANESGIPFSSLSITLLVINSISDDEREKFKYLQPYNNGGHAGLICTSLAPLSYKNSVVSLSCVPLTIESSINKRLLSLINSSTANNFIFAIKFLLL